MEFEDASLVCDLDNKILTSILGEEDDEMSEVHPAQMSETLKGVQEMYEKDLDAEGRTKLMELLQQPSEKDSVAHCKDELIQRLAPPFCYLCEDLEIQPKSRLYRHFRSVHLGHHVKVASFFIASCKLSCSSIAPENLVHYHCPYPKCEITVKAKNRVITHFKKHLDYLHLSYKSNDALASMKEVPNQKIKKSLVLKENLDFPAPKKV